MGRNGAMHAVAFGAAMLAVAFDANAATLVDCTFKGGGGDAISRGFYVSNYAGTTVDTVTIAHAAPDSERRTIKLTMRLNAYNGPILGVSEHTRTIGPEAAPTIFRFDGAVVPAGARLVFTQAVTSGAANVNYDVGAGPCSNVTQTEGTAAPLDDFRRATVGVMITGSPTDITDVTTFSCPYDPGGASDRIDRGFYVTNYPGVSIRTVSLRLRSLLSGDRWILVDARLGTYDGPLIGSASLLILGMGTSTHEYTFSFGNKAVPAGSTIAFVTRLFSGTDEVYFDRGFGPCLDAIETHGTAPPLDEFRRESMGLKITGDVASAAPITAVEYYHAGFGHYFLTAQADEIAGLDGGAYGGAFARTGLEFNVRDGPADGTIPVCRFFTVTFAPKSSHFYTSDPGECEAVRNNPDWQFEKIAFYVHRDDSGCPAGTIPVYRIYNNGQTGAPNHRFTTNLALYGNFVNTQGWAAEGVRFCVPQ